MEIFTAIDQSQAGSKRNGRRKRGDLLQPFTHYRTYQRKRRIYSLNFYEIVFQNSSWATMKNYVRSNCTSEEYLFLKNSKLQFKPFQKPRGRRPRLDDVIFSKLKTPSSTSDYDSTKEPFDSSSCSSTVSHSTKVNSTLYVAIRSVQKKFLDLSFRHTISLFLTDEWALRNERSRNAFHTSDLNVNCDCHDVEVKLNRW